MDSAQLNDFFNRLQPLVDAPARASAARIVQGLRQLHIARPAELVVVRDVVAGLVLSWSRVPDSTRYGLVQGLLAAVKTDGLIRVLEHWLAGDQKPVDARIRRVLVIVRKDFRKPKACRLCRLARVAKLSPSYLSKLTYQETGRHLTNHIRDTRVGAVKQMMARKPGLPLAHVARKTGFSDASDLCNTFKALTGCSPKQYVRLNTSVSKR